MKKLRLDIESIAVESFATDERTGERRGTVHGHVSFRCSVDPDNTCAAETCDNAYTCALSCGLCGSYKCGSAAEDSCVLSYCPPFC